MLFGTKKCLKTCKFDGVFPCMICKKNTGDPGGNKLNIPRINISAGLAGIHFIFCVEI